MAETPFNQAEERIAMRGHSPAAGTQLRQAEAAATVDARYLRYDEATPVAVGINHLTRNLEVLMREAHLLGRLAILPTLNLTPRHNFGIERRWRWETYYDFDKSLMVDADGSEHALPLARDRGDPDLDFFTVPPKARIPPSAQPHRLVVRRITDPVHGRDVPLAAQGPPDVRLAPSARVLALADPVVAELRRRGGGRFAAVHVRRGDRLFGPMRWLTRPRHVRARLQALGFPDGGVVFVLSDEWRAGFWDQLARHYGLARHTDFPRLAALVDRRDGEGPDNYLLYAVEKQIMGQAALRLETFPGSAYERYDATLVPEATWAVARFARRSAHAFARLVNSLLGMLRRVVGPRAWSAAKRIAQPLRRPTAARRQRP